MPSDAALRVATLQGFEQPFACSKVDITRLAAGQSRETEKVERVLSPFSVLLISLLRPVRFGLLLSTGNILFLSSDLDATLLPAITLG